MIVVYVLWSVTLLAILAAGAFFALSPLRRKRTDEPAEPGIVERLKRSKVVVTLKTGETFGGVLWEHDETTMVLRGAYLIGAAERGENLPVDGELLVYVDTVSYWQKP